VGLSEEWIEVAVERDERGEGTSSLDRSIA